MSKFPSQIVFDLVSFLYEKYENRLLPHNPQVLQCVLIDWLLNNNIIIREGESHDN
jgi:hypothetical protein